MKLNGFLLAVLSLIASLAVQAACDQPDVADFGGTGYHEGNWYSYQLDVVNKTNLQFGSGSDFLLSPRYGAPIRKIVLNVMKAGSATRTLAVRPLFDGIESDESKAEWNVPNDQLDSSAARNFIFDFSPDEKVDAFRIAGGSGSGSVNVSKLLVFYGDKDADEDAKLLELAQQLPTPQNLRIAALDSESHALTLAADPVEKATGYRFVLEQLTGLPRTEVREDFVGAPELSAGWTWGETNNVSFEVSTSSNYYDAKTTSDRRALKVVLGKGNDFQAEIVSPLVPERITEVSFVCKATSANLTDKISVWGRNSQGDAWTRLAEESVPTSMAWMTNVVPQDVSVRQVKFAFTAGPDSSANCILDTLRVVYGGDEERTEVVPGGKVVAEPTCTFDGLEGDGRYAYRVQAVRQNDGDTAYRDSSWTDEQRFEMAWASVSVEPPTGIEWDVDGSKMTVRWNAVAGADHYLVTVVQTDDPEHPVVRNARATGMSLVVTVPAAGEYSVQVTAVSPGGLKTAVSEATVGEVGVGMLASVSLKAVERQSVEASWTKVPLAEGYQAKLVKVGGTAETVEYGWSTDENGHCALPSGWNVHETDWTDAGYGENTWKSGTSVYPMLAINGWYLESEDRGQPLTKVVCAFKRGSAKSVVNTHLSVYSKTSGGEWKNIAKSSALTSLSEFKMNFTLQDDVRQLRFAAEGEKTYDAVNLCLGKLTLVYGEEERSVVESVRVTDTKVAFRNLDPNGRYEVVVVPLPSEGESLGATSKAVDLSQEKFRLTGAYPLSLAAGGRYDEDFQSLTTTPTRVSGSKVETRSLDLDYWQLNQGAGAAETATYSSKTNLTTGGIYVLSDEAHEADSFRLGTLATGSYGCTLGIALKNDTEQNLTVTNLSFKTVQRTFKAKTASYAFEWLVTDGATGVDAEGDWHPVDIATTAPYVAGDPVATGEFVQTISIGEAADLPGKLQPGSVLILRWRHAKGASGPAMGIDDVKVEMLGLQKGFTVYLK